MAEPVLRDPASPEPARRPGPQPVPAAAADLAASEVPAPRTLDPSHELPATASEPRKSIPAPASTGRTRSSMRAPRGRTASQEMLEELRKRLEDLRERVEKQTSEAAVSLKRELSQDADYVKIRARYYHERRPLQALGMVAAAGFVLGVFVGLWRR